MASFKQVVNRENLLKENFAEINKSRRYFPRFYYELGKEWTQLGNFQKAKNYFWQAFLSWPLRIGCLYKIMRITIKASPYRYSALKRNAKLNPIIKNQRVLIIGSGPSANDLKSIPKDVKILTCNIGPRLLLDKKFNREIDIYFSGKGSLGEGHKNEGVIDLLSKFKINLFVFFNKKTIKKHGQLKKFTLNVPLIKAIAIII
jgi:tetratricopeptide (TPR) repeat protein